MDDIDAAVEDAEYVRAMRDNVPQPTKLWDYLNGNDLVEYILNLQKFDSDALTLEVIASQNLGFYQFTKYCKDHGSNIATNFLVNIAHFKKQAHVDLSKTAKSIVHTFLRDGSTAQGYDCPTILGLCRKPVKYTFSASNCTSGGANAVHVCGDYVSRLVAMFSERRRSFSPANSFSKRSASSGPPTPSIALDHAMFDPVEEAVFSDLKETHFAGFMESEEWTRYHQFMAMLAQSQKNGLEENADFFVLRVVGRGGFGLVNACKKATTGKLYALKQMSKKRIKLKHCESLILAERNILTLVHSPYVVNLIYAFASPTDVFLVLDLMLGGDLSFHLKTHGRFTLAQTKYYIARTIMGLSTLHELGFVHRDLKPENILLDVQGRTRISDFGLAGLVPAEGFTKSCGTRGYWAPETIARPRTPYFLAVDWFSLGVCMFELLTGENPFMLLADQATADYLVCDKGQFDTAVDRAIMEAEPDFTLITSSSSDAGGLQQSAGDPAIKGDASSRNSSCGDLSAPGSRRRSVLQIHTGTDAGVVHNTLKSPSSARSLTSLLSARRNSTARGVPAAVSLIQATDLLRRLLAKDPTQRIGWGTGAGMNGCAEVMRHEWFADISWGALDSMLPPWRPEQEINTKAQSEIGEFADSKDASKVRLEEADQAHYKDWNFVSDRAFQDEIVEFLLYEEVKGPIRPAVESSCCVIC